MRRNNRNGLSKPIQQQLKAICRRPIVPNAYPKRQSWRFELPKVVTLRHMRQVALRNLQCRYQEWGCLRCVASNDLHCGAANFMSRRG